MSERLRRNKKRLAIIAYTLEITATIISTRHVAISANHTYSFTCHVVKLGKGAGQTPAVFAYIRVNYTILVHNKSLFFIIPRIAFVLIVNASSILSAIRVNICIFIRIRKDLVTACFSTEPLNRIDLLRASRDLRNPGPSSFCAAFDVKAKSSFVFNQVGSADL